jgi:N-acetylmuramoyl-L-alanine amidase
MSEKYDEIIARLDFIEKTLLRAQLESLEGNEGFEGDTSQELRAGNALSDFFAAAEFDAAETGMALARSREASLEAFIDGLGLNHFRGSEFTPYWSRVRSGIRNSPPPEELWKNIVKTLVVLDQFRAEMGSPVIILSTYRSPAYNQAVGGATRSEHKEFRAIDFTCRIGTPDSWARVLDGYRGRTFHDPHTDRDFQFRGGIGIYRGSNFVHLDTRGTDANWRG